MGTEDSRVKGYYVRLKSPLTGHWLDAGGRYAWPNGDWQDERYLYTREGAIARARSFNVDFTFNRAVVVKVSRKLHS